MELKRYFGVDELLNPSTAEQIYEKCTNNLQKPEFSTRSILNRMNVKVVCTTDDPVDDLGYHQSIKNSSFDIKILPAFRPDKAYAFDHVETYNSYIDKLSEVSDTDINSLSHLIEALHKRIDFFHENGCKLADHGLEKIYHSNITNTEANQAFKQIRSGKELSREQKHDLYHPD